MPAGEEITRKEPSPKYAPKEESFSHFYKFDDVKCYVANSGIARDISRIPVIHVKDIWPDDIWPYEG